MKILIVGASGMLGRRIARHLLGTGMLGNEPVHAVTTFDTLPSEIASGRGVILDQRTGDLTDGLTVDRQIADLPDLIFHLASVTPDEAESDFDKGYRINLDGTRNLLEAIRFQGNGYSPRVVFASSVTSLGRPAAQDATLQLGMPGSSFGSLKLIGELLVNDYSRKGFVDGVALRLPNIVSPDMIARLPARGDQIQWVISPNMAAQQLLHAAQIADLGCGRCLTMPGLAIPASDLGGAIADPESADSLPAPGRVLDWPGEFAVAAALSADFPAEADLPSMLRNLDHESAI